MSLSPLILRRAPWPIACGRFARRSVAAGSCGLDLAGDGVEFPASAGRLLRLPAPVKDGRADVQRMGEVGEGAEGIRAGTCRLGSFAPAALDRGRTSPTRTAMSCRPLGTGRSRLGEKYVLDGERSSRSARLAATRWYGGKFGMAGAGALLDQFSQMVVEGVVTARVAVSGDCPAQAATPRGWGCTGGGLCVLHESPTSVEYTRTLPSSTRPSCSTSSCHGNVAVPPRAPVPPGRCLPSEALDGCLQRHLLRDCLALLTDAGGVGLPVRPLED